MKPEVLIQSERPLLLPELLAGELDENGLVRLYKHDDVAEMTRLAERGLTAHEQAVAAPWYAANGTKDGSFPEEGNRALPSEFAIEFNIAPSTGQKAIDAALKNSWIEVEETDKWGGRLVAMKATEQGLEYIENNPSIARNVAFIAMRVRRNQAQELWNEVAIQNRIINASTEAYQGESETSLLGLNQYIKELRKIQLENLEVLDVAAAQEVKLANSEETT